MVMEQELVLSTWGLITVICMVTGDQNIRERDGK